MTVRVPGCRAGQTVLGSTFSTTPGGKGANQAVAARRAGAEVVFVTAVGNDDLGKRSLELYRREGIDVSHVRIVEGVASGVALIFVGDDGENMIGVASGANHRLTPDDIDRLPASLFRAGDVLLASLEIPVETAIRALRRGIEAGMRTILNPAPAPSLSESEATELLVGRDRDHTQPRRGAGAGRHGPPRHGVEPDWAACGSRLQQMGPAAVVITLGSRGCQVVAGRASVGSRASGRGGRHRRRRRCVQWCAGGRPGGGTAARGRRLGQRRRGAGRHPARCPVGLAVSRRDRPTGDAGDRRKLSSRPHSSEAKEPGHGQST